MDLEPAQAAQLCSVIDETGSLPPITILELLKANVAPCAPGACKSNRKDHPGCFCCLAPALGSSRKKGLWQKESGLLGGLGPDPEDKKREVRAQRRINAHGTHSHSCYHFPNHACDCLHMHRREGSQGFEHGLRKHGDGELRAHHGC